MKAVLLLVLTALVALSCGQCIDLLGCVAQAVAALDQNACNTCIGQGTCADAVRLSSIFPFADIKAIVASQQAACNAIVVNDCAITLTTCVGSLSVYS